jgi:hypothetical protein
MNATTSPDRCHASKPAKPARAATAKIVKKTQNTSNAASPAETVAFGEPPSGPDIGQQPMPAVDIEKATTPGPACRQKKVLLKKTEVCRLMKLSSGTLDKMEAVKWGVSGGTFRR